MAWPPTCHPISGVPRDAGPISTRVSSITGRVAAAGTWWEEVGRKTSRNQSEDVTITRGRFLLPIKMAKWARAVRKIDLILLDPLDNGKWESLWEDVCDTILKWGKPNCCTKKKSATLQLVETDTGLLDVLQPYMSSFNRIELIPAKNKMYFITPKYLGGYKQNPKHWNTVRLANRKICNYKHKYKLAFVSTK